MLFNQIGTSVLGILVFAVCYTLRIYQDMPHDLKIEAKRRPMHPIAVAFGIFVLGTAIVVPIALLVLPWTIPSLFVP